MIELSREKLLYCFYSLAFANCSTCWSSFSSSTWQSLSMARSWLDTKRRSRDLKNCIRLDMICILCSTQALKCVPREFSHWEKELLDRWMLLGVTQTSSLSSCFKALLTIRAIDCQREASYRHKKQTRHESNSTQKNAKYSTICRWWPNQKALKHS